MGKETIGGNNGKTTPSADLHPRSNWKLPFLKPDGPGPFPPAILNHGKSVGLPRNQERFRSAFVATYFLSLGYTVILPMMCGFSCSGGQIWVRGCNVESMGILHVRDMQAAIQFQKALWRRQPDHGLRMYADRGVQYAGAEFRDLLRDRQRVQCMNLMPSRLFLITSKFITTTEGAIPQLGINLRPCLRWLG